MPCAAGSLCEFPELTPDSQRSTGHKCRICGGQLHGTCGVPDPLGDCEMKRVCRPCVSSNTRKEPEAGIAEPAAKRLSTINLVDNASRKKARGADHRGRLTVAEQIEALDLLKTMSGVAVAKKYKIGVSTLYNWKKNEAAMRKKAEGVRPDAKSFKQAMFPDVSAILGGTC